MADSETSMPLDTVARKPLSPLSMRIRLLCVLAPGLAGIVLLLCLGPIPQDPFYHDFADTRSVFGISNTADVITNLAFFIVGLRALFFMARSGGVRRGIVFEDNKERIAYTVIFAGLIITALGSAWYHLAPDNGRLLWDRFGMTLVFMPLLSIIITERISLRAGTALLWPLVVFGVTSVFYWYFTERAGSGDLRLYGLVQFYPLAAIPLALLLFPPRYSHANYFWGCAGWYLLAKACELLDKQIFSFFEIVSGHTLKHLLAAVSLWWLVRMLQRRRPLAPTEQTHP